MSNVTYTAKLVRGQTFVYKSKVFRRDEVVKVSESEKKYLENQVEIISAGANAEAIPVPRFEIKEVKSSIVLPVARPQAISEKPNGEQPKTVEPKVVI